MVKKIFFIAFNFWVVIALAADSTGVVTSDALALDTSFSVMSGIFTVGENKDIPKDGKIIVKDADTEKIVGVYYPNKTTGKYLFILPPGKSYSIRYEVKGNLYKSQNLIVPRSSRYKKIKRKINLGGL